VGGGTAYSEAASLRRRPHPRPLPATRKGAWREGRRIVWRDRAQPTAVIASAAKQSMAQRMQQAKMDCFVASAPRNDDRHTSAISPHEFFARGIHLFRPPDKGRGECRAADAPDSRVCNGRVERTHVSRSHRNHPALPTQWFTDYTCAPRCSGFLATVTGGIASANLTPASRCQDYTTSPSARKRPRQKRHLRPPHPAPRFATIMIRPFEWDGMAGI